MYCMTSETIQLIIYTKFFSRPKFMYMYEILKRVNFKDSTN